MAIFRKHTKPADVTPSQKKVIDKAVKKVVKEYGETLVLLGKE